MTPKKSPSPVPAKLVTVTELATVLGVDKRRVQQLVSDGVLKKEGRGQYDLGECTLSYSKWKVEAAAAAKAKRTGSDDEDGDGDTRRKLHAEANSAEHKAELLRLKVEEEQGRLIPANQVADAWGKVLSNVKTKLLAVPTSAAPGLLALPNEATVAEHLRKHITAALADLAQIGRAMDEAAAVGGADASGTDTDNG